MWPLVAREGGTQEPCGHWRSHIHGSGTRNATGSVDFISSCSAFLRRHKGTHNGTRIRPIWLAALLFWMFWERDPCLWKNNVLLQFHTRAPYYCVKRMHRYWEGFRKSFEKGFQKIKSERRLTEEPSLWHFMRVETTSVMWSQRQGAFPACSQPHLRALQPVSLALEFCIPSNALFISLPAPWE